MKPALAGLFVCLLAVRAQTPLPGAIDVVVVEAGTGSPVPSAEVRLVQNYFGIIKEAVADSSGRLSIKDIAPGEYVVMVSRRGFTNAMVRTKVVSGQPLDSLRIELKRPGVITGKVLDQNKQPRSGIQIRAVSSYYTDRGRLLMGTGSFAETDDRGEYRISGLDEGEYYLIARRMGPEPSESGVTFYPGIADLRTAAKVAIKSGGEVRAGDFSLIREQGFKISLRVVPPGGAARPDIRDGGIQAIILVARGRPVPEDWEWGLFGRAPGSNTFTSQTRLPVGTYDLYIRHDDPTKTESVEDIINYSACSHATVTLSIKDVDVGDIKMQRGVPIPGRFVFKDGRPTDFDATALRVVPNSELRCTLTRPVSVSADGTFTLPNNPRGRFRFRVEGVPGDYYVESARYAGREVLDTGMTIENEGAGPLEITLADKGGIVDGIARNAKDDPAADATVVLIPPAERRTDANYRYTKADKSGAFRFTGLRPGEYRLFVWEGAVPQYRDPDVIKTFETRGTRLTVQRGLTSSAGNVRALPPTP
jgi:hypothetical protein